MKVTVCELTNDPASFERDWQDLVLHVQSEASRLVLLPEMPFYPWIAYTNHIDEHLWQASVEAHDKWMNRLIELSPAIVLGTRPVIEKGRRFNQGFCWDAELGYRAAHNKYYLPNEEGFWEASWYARGTNDFSAIPSRQLKLGFLICSEIWFGEHARAYARQGIHVLACPRATPKSSLNKWIAGGRAAAVVSGAFCLSSSFSGKHQLGFEWAGAGWIIEPEEGEVLGQTSPQHPFLTLEIDLKAAENAKYTYPRYIQE